MELYLGETIYLRGITMVIFIVISIAILAFIIYETKKQNKLNILNMTEGERNDIKQTPKFKGDIKITKKKFIILSTIIVIVTFIVGFSVGDQSAVDRMNAKTTADVDSSGQEVTPDTTPVATTPVVAPTWQPVQTFTGSNITKTAPFTIDASATAWGITWSTTPGSMGDMNFIVDLDDASGNMVDSVANCIGVGNSVINETAPGDYILDINTSQSYTITVEELK